MTLSPRIRITTPKLSRSSSFNKIIREVLTASTSAAPVLSCTPPPLLVNCNALLTPPFGAVAHQMGAGATALQLSGTASHEIDLSSADLKQLNQLCLDMKMTSMEVTPIVSPRGVAQPPYMVPMTPLAPLNSMLSMTSLSSNPYYPAFTPTGIAPYPSVPSQVPSQAPYFAMYPQQQQQQQPQQQYYPPPDLRHWKQT